MISLQRQNGHPVLVNADLIETVERNDGGESVVTLTSGNVLLVANEPEAIRLAVVAYRRSIAVPLGVAP